MQEYLRIGSIIKPHGVRGELKVYPTTDDARRFDDLIGKTVYLDIKGNYEPVIIDSVKYFKNLVIIKLDNIKDCDEAEEYRNIDIYVDRANAIPLEEGEYYIADLIGCKVYLSDNTQFGVLKDVLQTGANDVYVVDSIEHGEVYIPVIKDCINSVDIENKKIIVTLLKGLI